MEAICGIIKKVYNLSLRLQLSPDDALNVISTANLDVERLSHLLLRRRKRWPGGDFGAWFRRILGTLAEKYPRIGGEMSRFCHRLVGVWGIGKTDSDSRNWLHL